MTLSRLPKNIISLTEKRTLYPLLFSINKASASRLSLYSTVRIFPPFPTHHHHSQETTENASRELWPMPTDQPEPLALVPFELQAGPAPPPARSGGGGKMHRLLRSAFKRGDSASAGSGEDADQLSRSASGSSSSAASSGRPPSGRRVGRRGADGSSVDGDRSSRESFELNGETGFLPSFALPCSVHHFWNFTNRNWAHFFRFFIAKNKLHCDYIFC